MSGSVDQNSVQTPTILNSDENLNNPSIENPQEALKPSLGFISGDHQTSPSECNQVKDYEENAEKQSEKPSLGCELTSESENPSEGHEFSVGDLVWAKVKYHPWWPGQIFDSSDASETALKASESALKPHKEDRLLVAHFGDQTFSWCKVSSLKPFKENFKEMSTQCNSKVLYTAMHHALDELARRVQLGLSCSCHASRKFKEESIVNWGIKEGTPVNQHSDIALAVTEFDPKSLVAYTRELAVCPRAEDELEVAVTCARISAGRILAPLTDSSSLTPAKAYKALSSKKSKNKSKGKGSTDVKYTRRSNKGGLDDNDDDREVWLNGQRFKTPTEKLPGKKLLFPTSVHQNSIASVSATDRVALLSEVGKVSKVGASITRIALQLVGSPASTPRDQKCNTEIDGSKLQLSQSGKGRTKKKAKTPRRGKIHNKVSALKEEVYQMYDEEDVDLGSGSIKSGLKKHKMGTSSSEPKSQKKGKWQGKGITKVSEIVDDGEDIKKAKRQGKGLSKDLENVDDGEDRKKAKWQRKGTSKDLENVDDGEDVKKAKRQRKGTSKDLENADDGEDTKKTKQQRKGTGKDLENVDDGEDTKKAKRQRKGTDKDLENVDDGEDTKKAKRQRKGTGKDLENVDDGEDTKKAKRQRKGTGKDLENVDDREDTKKSARRQRKGISKDSENRSDGEDTKKTKRQTKGISKDSENVVDRENTKKTNRQRKEVSKDSENVDDGEDTKKTKRQRKGISKDSENVNDREDDHVGDREDTDEEYGSVKELLLELFLLARDPTNCNGLKGRFSRLNDSFLKFRTAAFQGSSFKLSGCSTTKESKQRNKKSDVGSTETPEEKKQDTRSSKRKFEDQIEDTGKQIDSRKLNGISLGNEKQTNNQVEGSGKQIDARKSNGISLGNEEQTDDVDEIPEACILMDVDAPTKANSDRNGNVSESTDLEGSQKEHTLEPLGDSKIDESKPEETTKATSDVTVNEAYNSVSVSTPIQSPIALFMTFPSGFSVPEENDLSKKFARYGKVTEVVRFVESGCARLIFQKHSDAELAFRSATGDKLFSPALVSFRLRYLSPKSS